MAQFKIFAGQGLRLVPTFPERNVSIVYRVIQLSSLLPLVSLLFPVNKVYLKRWPFSSNIAEATITILSLAAGELDEASFAEWLRRHIEAKNA